MLQQFSRYFSNALSPLLMPSYGVFLALWVSILCYQSFVTRITVLIFIVGITCVLPLFLLYILQTIKIIPDTDLSDRKDRIIPYAIATICYLIATYYLYKVHAPLWLLGFMIGVVSTSLVSFIINLKWKISAHTAGIGGVVALLFFLHHDHMEAFDSLWVLCFTIILAGIIGSIRLYLQCHTLAQVLVGFANGFLCVHFFINLLY